MESHKKEEARRGGSTRPWQESLQTFAQSDFDEWHFVARLLQHAETAGVVICNVQIAIGVAFPQPSQNEGQIGVGVLFLLEAGKCRCQSSPGAEVDLHWDGGSEG